MRFRSLLLRVLLCLALLANGTTAVFASARMTLDVDMAMAMQHDAAPPCHEDANDEAPKRQPVSHDDCCGTGACLCSCVAHAPAFLTVDAMLLATPRAAPPVSAPHVSRATPALPHPIRPPIG